MTHWGWKSTQLGFQPVHSNDMMIPEELVKKVTCRCETGCKTMTCNCRKYGLRCTHLRNGYHGESCTNIEHIPSPDLETNENEIEKIISDDFLTDVVSEDDEGNDVDEEIQDESCYVIKKRRII